MRSSEHGGEDTEQQSEAKKCLPTDDDDSTMRVHTSLEPPPANETHNRSQVRHSCSGEQEQRDRLSVPGSPASQFTSDGVTQLYNAVRAEMLRETLT
jgi:hypothetical protein